MRRSVRTELRDAVVAIDDASRQLGLGVATRILVAARRLSADQARVRALIALDECQRPLPGGCLAPAAGLSIEKLTEAFIAVRPRLHEAQHAVQPFPVVVRRTEAPARWPRSGARRCRHCAGLPAGLASATPGRYRG